MCASRARASIVNNTIGGSARWGIHVRSGPLPTSRRARVAADDDDGDAGRDCRRRRRRRLLAPDPTAAGAAARDDGDVARRGALRARTRGGRGPPAGAHRACRGHVVVGAGARSSDVGAISLIAYPGRRASRAARCAQLRAPSPTGARRARAIPDNYAAGGR